MSQQIYFFSRHEAQAEMIADLGGHITEQFRGTISGIKKIGDKVCFLEIPLGQTEAITHSIPADSIVVAVCPLPLQEQWLKSGVTLLLPQNNRTTTETGEVVFNYAGLLQVEEIKIVTKQWAGISPSLEQKHQERTQLS